MRNSDFAFPATGEQLNVLLHTPLGARMHPVDRIPQTRRPAMAVDHPVVAVKLAILRDKSTPRYLFRTNMQELAAVLLVEAARSWETRAIEVETPLRKCQGRAPERPVTLVPILRAGLGMLDGMLRILPDVAVGHIGVYRDEEMLRPVTYFSRLPPDLRETQVVLVDPMLATGNSACAAVSLLKASGAEKIQFICIVSCPPGIAQLQSSHPDVDIITAAIDPELNDFGFIVPGLGDAGDRYFGTEHIYSRERSAVQESPRFKT
jgi:uracil phosphoribosyltransferase